MQPARTPARALAALAALLPLACAGPRAPAPPPPPAHAPAATEPAPQGPIGPIGPPAPRPSGEPEPEPEDALPVVPLDADDWLQATSGEWLKGELVVMEDEEVLFDSDELDDVTIDWEDVLAIRTSRALSVITNDLASHVGVVTLEGDVVRVAGPGDRKSVV